MCDTVDHQVEPSTTLSLVAKLFVSSCDHWCKVARDQHLGFTFTRLHPHVVVAHGTMVSLLSAQTNACGERLGSLLVHSWCTSCALLVHSWCTSGAFFGALLVHSRCTPKVSRKGIVSLPKRKPRSSVQKRLDRFFANLQTRKGIALLPKGSLDPPQRNVWITFLPTCKPERELHRFRKEVSILRTETFGSPFRQLANPKGNCTASERKPRSSAQKRLDRLFANLQTRKGNCTASERKSRSSAQKRLDRPRHYHIHHRRRRNHDQAAAKYPSDAPNREVDERAWGPSGTKSCWNLSLREYSDVHT